MSDATSNDAGILAIQSDLAIWQGLNCRSDLAFAQQTFGTEPAPLLSS